MNEKWYPNATSIEVAWSDGISELSGLPKNEGWIFHREGSIPIKPGALIGHGFDTFKHALREAALKDTGVKSLVSGQTKEFSIQTITSNSELNEALGVGAHASFSGWGVTADAKADWSKNRNLNSYNVYLLIRVKVMNSPIHIKSMELSRSAKSVLGATGKDVKSFFTKYGDTFISSFETGGEFYALYEFHTTSEHDREALSVQASAGCGTWTAAAEFEKKMNSLNMSADSTLKLFVAGGRGKLGNPSPEKLTGMALAFPEAVDPEAGAPVVFEMSVLDYQVVDGFPSRPPNFSRSHLTFQDLAHLRDRLITAAADYEYAQKNQARFVIKKAPPTAEIKNLEKKIHGLVEQIREDPMSLVEIPDSIEEGIEKLEVGVPQHAKVEHGVIYGQRNGRWFDDATDRKVLLSRKIRTIQVRSGRIWDGFAMHYLTDQGLYSPGTRGGEGGRSQDFTLADGEYLTRVTGQWGVNRGKGSWLSQVRFYTNLNSEGLGYPYGGEGGGTKFEINAPGDSMIIGLQGYSCQDDDGLVAITALGAVFAKKPQPLAQGELQEGSAVEKALDSVSS